MTILQARSEFSDTATGVKWSSVALLLGNLIVGLATLGPAAMLVAISTDLSVSLSSAGLLVTLGGIVLCLASPTMAWLTRNVDRRTVLVAALTAFAIGHLLSALMPNLTGVLVIRLVMLALGAIYTPGAAGTIAMLVDAKDRPGAIAFVFLGLSLSIAAGLPLLAFSAEYLGWRVTYLLIGGASAVAALLLHATLPSGIRGAPIPLSSWRSLLGSWQVVILLSITTLFTASQYVIFPYFGALLEKLGNADTRTVAMLFAVLGVMGFVGNLIATKVVSKLGSFATSSGAILIMLAGLTLWSIGSDSLPLLTAGVAFWGLGFAAANSMQHARLVGAAPSSSSLAIAFNTSWLFVGQAIGSAIGGLLFSRNLLPEMGITAVFLMASAGITVVLTRGFPR